jgi:BMFP domain-containing protein YqiC
MVSPPHFETLFKHFTEALPKGALTLQQEMEKNLRIALEAALRRLNVVTREEFDVQSAVLARTRARLEALEAQVAALEATHLTPDDVSTKPTPTE